MDQSNRRKVNASKKDNKNLKAKQELNGNMQDGAVYNIDNMSSQNQRREFYKPKGIGSARIGDGVGNYLPLHGQRLFAAMSDPAVCGYPLSLYPYDHIPVPMGYSIYQQPPPYPQPVPCKEAVPPPRKGRQRKHCEKIKHPKDTFQTLDEYTSLPPGNFQDFESDQQRRFSDPGLANNTGSEADSLSDDVSSGSWYGDSQLSSHIEMLILENKRLSKELKETQTELQNLKCEVASLVQAQTTCEPGFVADLVREIRETTKLREETILAKLMTHSKNLQQNKPTAGGAVGERLDQNELTQRLAKLETQMKQMLLHNSVQENTKENLFDTKKENKLLQQELKATEEARITAEAIVAKYERVLNSLSKRLPNGVVLEEKFGSTAVSSLESSESLSSSLGSGSLHSPQVTMSGPVTDL